MSEETKKFTKPVFMKKLAAKCDSLSQLGDLVGCSGSHAGNIVNEKSECALAYELAAENIFQKQHGGGHVDKVAIISAPDHVLKTVEMLVVQLNGKFHLVP